MGLFSRRTRGVEPVSATLPSVAGPHPGVRVFDDVPIWFTRFGDIPGITYSLGSPEPTAGRSRLAGSNERPWIQERRSPEGKLEGRSLQWPGTPGRRGWEPSHFGHTWSPAHRIAFNEPPEPSIALPNLFEWLTDALDLPGKALDYHFAIQFATENLWKRRDQDDFLQALVEVATLDLLLVQAVPETLATFAAEGTPYFRSEALERLAAAHEQLGNLEAAYEVTVVAGRFDQLEPRRKRLAKKLGRSV